MSLCGRVFGRDPLDEEWDDELPFRSGSYRGHPDDEGPEDWSDDSSWDDDDYESSWDGD